MRHSQPSDGTLLVHVPPPVSSRSTPARSPSA